MISLLESLISSNFIIFIFNSSNIFIYMLNSFIIFLYLLFLIISFIFDTSNIFIYDLISSKLSYIYDSSKLSI